MYLYLDNNIIIDIENGLLSIEKIESNLAIECSKVFFSAAHIDEAMEITGGCDQERVESLNKRFSVIEEITGSNYLYADMKNNMYKLKQKPSEVYETLLSSHSLANPAIKGFANLIPVGVKISIRKLLDLDPVLLNNIPPDEVIGHLNRTLKNSPLKMTFQEMLAQAKEFHPDGSSFGLQHDIAGLFEFLDMMGYWKDKYTKKSNFARSCDSRHVFFAAYCDYFISDDKRTRNKAKVAYSLYGIGTKVVSSKGEE